MTDPTGMRSVSTSVPNELYDEIDMLARTNDRTVSAQIRRMIKDWFGAQELERKRDDLRSTVGTPSITVPNRTDAPHRPYTAPLPPGTTQTWPPTSSPLSD